MLQSVIWLRCVEVVTKHCYVCWIIEFSFLLEKATSIAPQEHSKLAQFFSQLMCLYLLTS